MARFISYNGPSPTTAALAPVTTGTAIKTMLQVAPVSTRPIEVVAWGVSFDGTTFGNKIKCELIDTDVAATVTAHVAAGVVPYGADRTASLVTLGTAATGYTASAEGTTTAARLLDYQLVDQSTQYPMWFPLGDRGQVAVSRFLRVRLTAAVAVNAVCWILWNE